MTVLSASEQAAAELAGRNRWRHFVWLFCGWFLGSLGAIYLFILVVDPYDIIPFSIPMDRQIVSISQRYTYPQIVRSGKFDSMIVGTSTSRLVDPAVLSESFGARFANLAMDSMMAWEQQAMADLFIRHVPTPKVLIFGLDHVWCDPDADRNRITPRGFPEWLYDDNPWNNYLYLFNRNTLEIAGRLVGYQLGLYPVRVRYDGFEEFTPPDHTYDPVKARKYIWGARRPEIPPDIPTPPLDDRQRMALSFPALNWMEAILARLPPSTLKVLVFMPVHIAAQPWPGTRAAAIEQECKGRIAAIARKAGAKVIDYRIASPITREDTNYWDNGHYRIGIGRRIARELGPAAREGWESPDESYRVVVR
jgi:hypothetical protein